VRRKLEVATALGADTMLACSTFGQLIEPDRDVVGPA
jgi:hypothetical protein